ncbi:MAG: DUF1990 family protein [Micromonosporaceae bacterium]
MSRLTYPEVGATLRGPLPYGYRVLRYRTPIGTGCFERAAEAVLTWRLHRVAGVRVTASAERAAPGVTVTCALGAGPLRILAPCEVVWTVEEERRAGFGYGTLPGHPARGEECFEVVQDESGRVEFAVTAFSLPARWQMRAAGPVAPLLQRAYAWRLGRTLRRLCRSG